MQNCLSNGGDEGTVVWGSSRLKAFIPRTLNHHFLDPHPSSLRQETPQGLPKPAPGWLGSWDSWGRGSEPNPGLALLQATGRKGGRKKEGLPT